MLMRLQKLHVINARGEKHYLSYRNALRYHWIHIKRRFHFKVIVKIPGYTHYRSIQFYGFRTWSTLEYKTLKKTINNYLIKKGYKKSNLRKYLEAKGESPSYIDYI